MNRIHLALTHFTTKTRLLCTIRLPFVCLTSLVLTMPHCKVLLNEYNPFHNVYSDHIFIF